MSTNDRPSTDDSRTHLPTERSGEPPEPIAGERLIARETTTADGVTECTIYPVEVPEDRRTTTWITAEEGSYVALDERL